MKMFCRMALASGRARWMRSPPLAVSMPVSKGDVAGGTGGQAVVGIEALGRSAVLPRLDVAS
jgi:hypothetical protein